MKTESRQLRPPQMTKTELIQIITKLLEPDGEIDFLLKLDAEELAILAGFIRERIEASDRS